MAQAWPGQALLLTERRWFDPENRAWILSRLFNDR
jgi:hypothetical protein